MAKFLNISCLIILLFGYCDSAYFDDQPKLLTENGNFVIESAVDRNVSFRLKGTSYLNINDVNIMLLVGNANRSSSAASGTSNANLAVRLSTLEGQFRQYSTPSRQNRIQRRLTALESRLGVGSNATWGSLTRRVRQLEIKMQRILVRLSSDNCTSNPCLHGGTCTNTFGGYTCQCLDTWTGSNCEEDVNECTAFANTDLGCQNSITCENTPGGYTCHCKPGWLGIHCTKRTADCADSSAYEMCGHGVCVHTNDPTTYRCICDQGWTTSGSSPACTVDVNECESPQPHCSMDPEVACINLPGSYACGTCPQGYTGNGHFCRDVDECLTNNGGCSLSPFVSCINTRGSVKCGPCPFGYTGDGKFCVRSTDQAVPTPGLPISAQRCDSQQNPCHPLATCVQTSYSISCICPPNYSGSGYGIFGCTPSNSTTGGCASSPCLNGGTCINRGLFGYRCECPPNTVSPRCSRPLSVCMPNPCMHGGTCVAMGYTRYRCECTSNRSGRNCQLEVRACGGVLNSLNGTLKYPLSGTYSENSRCAWLIKTDEEKVLNVTFTKFHLEHSHDCRFDWLQIHDGRSSASYMIGRFCGDSLPKNGNIVSTQNMMYLWFRSDNSTAHEGFELSWNSVDPVCGGDITIESHGIIASPGSPGTYPPNRDCYWKLTAPADKRIQLHFFTLQIEMHEDCRYDYLAIYNGPSTDGDLLEKFCNTTHPEPLTSPANELTLHFHSDESTTDHGFQIHYSLIEGIQGCGGTFTSLDGEFGSPIQNGQYPKNLECHYLIRMPRRNETGVKLTFLSFNLESSSNCNFDYVEIYDGKNENAPKVGRWCGNRMPPSFSSTSGEVLVVFRSDFSFGGDGFRLKYETLCGGRFDEENGGVITSPWWPSHYQDNKNCPYDIEAPLGKAIVLNFTDFDIENDCDFDSLTIYDGVDANSTKIGTYCGRRKPPTAISTLNHMHLVFQTDQSNTGPGFRATYSFIDAGCGGIIKKLNMTISPPSNSDGYSHRSNCKWIIVAPLGFMVQLSFSQFEMENSHSCQYDYVAIYDNIIVRESSDTPAIGKYCGRENPPTMMSTSRAITIVFKSDESINGQGFAATYDFIDGRNLCGGNFYGLTGTITSPNFPDNYLPSRNCVYIINAPNGKQINLRVESFSLEESNGCGFDALEIRNGQNDKSPLMGTFCGTEILPRFKSFSNHIYLRFKTDSSNEVGGFKISYDTSSSGCGGLFTNTQSGTLTSPNYPEAYPANMQCDYTVQVARGSTVSLLLTDISMEQSTECIYDYISIYDGPNTASKLLGTYCFSEQIVQMESTSHVVFIRLVTDVSNQGRGFELKFNANCKRTIRDLQGAIESPNFPGQYPHYAHCEWKIIPPPGNRIYIEFSHFDLEHSWSANDEELGADSCMFDHLTIEEYDSFDTKIKTDKHCEAMPKPLNTSYTVVLKFETDFSNTAGGFHLEYIVEGCGGVLKKPEGAFSSPNYPRPYPHNTLCMWEIEAEYGHLIEITITDFDFEATPECTQDGLIISNDANATRVVQKFCGSIHNGQKATSTSISNRAFVHFYSDMSYAGRGFSATYKSIPAKCGGTFSFAQGNITSPQYPMNYPPNSYCQWLLRTEASHSVLFKFSDFDLEDDCSSDSVQVYDGPEKRADKLLLKSCGSQVIGSDSTNQTKRPGFTEPLKSTGNEMLIVMEADHGIEAKGFAAEYSTSCGSRIVTSSSGMLEVGHNLRWLTDDCEWVITAENPEQHVALTILHLENEPIIQKLVARMSNLTEATCTKKVYVYDGTSTKAPKVAEICSSTHPPTIVSEGNSLTLSLGETVENDYAFTFDLKASYSVIDSDCGGEFTSTSGKIASPGYPKSYKNNIECEWTIKASPGNMITANVEMLDIDETDHCNGDYLEVRETSSTGKLVGVYCGRELPPTLAQANSYWLKFRSDNDGVGAGFLLEYNYAKVVEQSGSTSGVITSPMYPSYLYYTTGKYGWRINVQTGFVVRLIVDDCILKRDSTIEVYDGYDSASPLLIDIENDALPVDPILSTTNVMYIQFGISSMSESKFKLDWSEVEKSVADLQLRPSNTLNCTGNSVLTVYAIDRLQLTSPGYPTGYAANLNCVWTFLPATPGYHVDITFAVIDMEVTPNCLADYIQQGGGQDLQNFDMDARMCSMSQVLRGGRYHGAPNLRVKFNSDYANNRTGFSSTISLDCGGLLDGPHGEITNKMTVSNGTAQNMMNETCTWTITVQTGRTIQFEFTKLNLAKNDDGSCNSYIILRNGIHDDSPFLGLGKYCNGISAIPATSSNKAIVQFARNRMSRKSNEFTLKYQQVEHECGGSHTLDYSTDSVTISTPNYPNIPTPHIECVWRVAAPNGELLKLEFVDRFDLTPSIDCLKEYVELREGTTTTAPVIGRYCREKPQPIYTASNMLRLLYFTDVAVPRNGFKVKVSFARCGKSVVANSGFIASPGFPGQGAYPTSATCDYHITGRIGTTVNITFFDLDLPYARNCSEVDHLIIYSMVRQIGGNVTYTEVRKICGDNKPESILTYSSSALVRFVTKSSNSHMYGGFRFKFQSSLDTCGGRIEASNGVIQSPGYPSSPDATKFCEWRITVPKGRRVRLEVADLDIKQSATVSPRFYGTDQTRITLYNDFSMYSLIHMLYMNNETSAVYYSTDNMMGVSALIRRSNAGYRGFKFRFSSHEPSTCSGNLNGVQGSINSPENLSKFYCEFERTDHTSLIQSQPNVGTLAVKVFEEYINSPNVTRQCTANLPSGVSFTYSNNDRRTLYTKCPPKYENILTPFSNGKLILRSSMVRKYHFTYKVHNCGGVLRSTTTRITLPAGLASDYGDLDCAWQFTSGTNRNIQFVVSAPVMDCDTSYLTIYRGSSPNRPRAARICGDSQTTNRTVFLQGQYAFIEYHTDSYNAAAAAALQIQIITSDGVCGGVIEVPNSLFSSPRNGTKYLPNTECEWSIRAGSGYHIGLTFVNRFMIEKSPSCAKDYLKVYDKVDGEFREIAKLCGRDFPPFLNSTGQEMKVLFHTDGEGDGDGFTAKWVENCGGTFHATTKQQYITSPRYPDPYPKRAYCNYSIVANEGESVSVRFLTVDLEVGNHLCNFDNITIYKYSQYGWPVFEEVGTYCRNGSMASVFRYPNRIDVIFRSDSFIERSGFKFEYSTDRCGGNVTESMQIGSINEDNTDVYMPLTTCVWFVTAPSDKKILIRYEQFELEYLLGCQLDYVDVYEGHRTDPTKRLSRLCGSLTGHAPAISVDSNKATIKFATDASVQEKGFRALILFTKNCNEHINLTSSNPRYILNKLTDQYEPLLNCEYFISAPLGYVIRARFSQLHLTPCTTMENSNNSCSCDYLNVRDGVGPFNELFGTFCGHSTPPDMLTTGGDMYMQFVTDQVSSGTGFSVEFEMIESPCGRNTYYLNDTMKSVTIQSPMDGNQYKANINCLWTIICDDGKLIDIKFDNFELESDADNKCMEDYLEISDEQSKPMISEGLGENTIFSGSPQSKNQYFYWGKQWPSAAHRYCGIGRPVDYLSATKTVYVRFKTDDHDQRSGFKFTAKIFSECARNYTALQGRLYGKSLADCEQYITVPENYTITLYFASLDFRTTQECSETKAPLAIYDGRNNNLLKHYCSDAIPKPLFTSTNQLRLKFQNMSLAYVMNELYDITYLATDKGRGCGGELYNYGGTFSSPGYPNTDRNRSDCTWTITVPMNLYVALHFQVFDMGTPATCELNYVELSERSADIAPTRFCGKDIPAPYKAKSNELKVRFKSGMNFAGTGWVANFMAVHENSILNNF